MIAAIHNNITSLKAHSRKLGVTANNIANVYSEGFKKSRAILEAGPSGDVNLQIDQINSPGHRFYEDIDGQLIERELSNVDLVEEIPQTMIAQRGYEANLKAIQVQDDMLGSVLDIIGWSGACISIIVPTSKKM